MHKRAISIALLAAATTIVGGIDAPEIERRVEGYEQNAGLLNESNFNGCAILPEACSPQVQQR